LGKALERIAKVDAVLRARGTQRPGENSLVFAWILPVDVYAEGGLAFPRGRDSPCSASPWRQKGVCNMPGDQNSGMDSVAFE
jgi:hypothetical protein